MGSVSVRQRKDRGPELERWPRRALAIGGALLALGLAFAALGAASTSAVVTLAGLVAVIHGIHTFGRIGTETRVSALVVHKARLSNAMVLGALTFGLGVVVLADGRASRAFAGSPSPDQVGGLLIALLAVGGGGVAVASARKRLQQLGSTERHRRAVEKG